MELFDEELYAKIKRGNKKIVSYFSYPVSTNARYYVVEEEAEVYNESMLEEPLNSDLVNMVDVILNKAHRLMGRQHRDNKEAVKCEVEGVEQPIYFIGYDSRRIIATWIGTHRGSKEYQFSQL